MEAFEKALVEQCAPTLAGIKPASLFRIGGEEFSAVRQCVRQWNRLFLPLGLRVVILKMCPETRGCLIYLYREKWLKQIVGTGETARFLKTCGYESTELSQILPRLAERFCLAGEYPHEVGVFLGYPLEDVIGFIRHKGRDFTCCGYWKCYGDPEAAQKCFARYRRCTAVYRAQTGSGVPIIQLVAAA